MAVIPTKMETTQTIVYVPPLTTNMLDDYQRSRLIRSTRKLGAILGTTPRLVEPEPIALPFPADAVYAPKTPASPRTKATRRLGSLFEFSPLLAPAPSPVSSPENSPMPTIYASSSNNSSVASLSLDTPRSSVDILPTPRCFSSKGRRSADAPRPLVLKLNTAPIEPQFVSKRTPLSPIMSPTTATLSAFPITPLSPVLPSAAETRRRRMAKVKRTLGENVPPELVFRPPPKVNQVKSLPTVLTKEQAPPRKSSSEVWVTGSNTGAWTGEWNRKDIKEVQQQLRELRVR